MTLEGAKRAMRRQPAGDAADRSGELLERLQRIRVLLVEVREDLKAADGEIVAVGDDYGAESPAETPASAPVSAERPAAAGSLAPDTPPAVSADDAATPAAEAPQAGIPDTETPARRRNRAVVKIDAAPGAQAPPQEGGAGALGAVRLLRAVVVLRFRGADRFRKVPAFGAAERRKRMTYFSGL